MHSLSAECLLEHWSSCCAQYVVFGTGIAWACIRLHLACMRRVHSMMFRQACSAAATATDSMLLLQASHPSLTVTVSRLQHPLACACVNMAEVRSGCWLIPCIITSLAKSCTCPAHALLHVAGELTEVRSRTAVKGGWVGGRM